MNLSSEELLVAAAFAPAAFLIGGIVGQSIASTVAAHVSYGSYVVGFERGWCAMADIAFPKENRDSVEPYSDVKKPWWAFWR